MSYKTPWKYLLIIVALMFLIAGTACSSAAPQLAEEAASIEASDTTAAEEDTYDEKSEDILDTPDDEEKEDEPEDEELSDIYDESDDDEIDTEYLEDEDLYTDEPEEDELEVEETIPEPEETPEETPEEAPEEAVEPETTPEAVEEETPSAYVAVPQDDGPVVLTITGNGVSSETAWTLSQLQAMTGGFRQNIYSTTNNWPSFGHTEAHGVSVPYLLGRAGVLDGAASFRFISTDGYHFTLSRRQIFNTLTSFANHSPLGSSGGSAVEPVIAWRFGDPGSLREANLRLFIGHSGPNEVNNAAFVRDLMKVEITTESRGTWAVPTASIADGSIVEAGTQLELLHDFRDNVKIYYTLDGSEPSFTSNIFNPSTSFFQPHLTVPIELTETVTIRAFAAGLGRDPSPVVTFTFTVE